MPLNSSVNKNLHETLCLYVGDDYDINLVEIDIDYIPDYGDKNGILYVLKGECAIVQRGHKDILIGHHNRGSSFNIYHEASPVLAIKNTGEKECLLLECTINKGVSKK